MTLAYQWENPELWGTNDGTKFKVIARYSTEDNDKWIEYENYQTKQRYTCRLEAFESRFTPAP